MRLAYLNKLSAQLVLISLLVVLVTAASIGLPAIWLLHSQLDQQAWIQVEQAAQTALSLFENTAYELQAAASLIAERPTLISLVEQNAFQSLDEYLDTLQDGAGLDLTQVCLSGELAAGTPLQLPLCEQPLIKGYWYAAETAWMIARTDLADTTAGEVVVGKAINKELAQLFKDQIGLDLALFDGYSLLSSSLTLDQERAFSISGCKQRAGADQPRLACSLDGVDHYLTSLPLSGSQFSLAVMLDLTSINASQRRLQIWMLITMLGIAAAATILGVVLSRGISRPLVKLSAAAASFSKGDLGTEVQTDSKLGEITQVARALENARKDLNRMIKILQSERDWSENLLESIVEAIITLDEQGRITFFSHGAERLTGLLGSDVLGREIDAIFPLADSSGSLYELLSSGDSREGYQKIDVILAGRRQTSLAITSACLTRSGAPDQETALVIRDISAEESFRRLLGQFFANVSHELRTPLTALKAVIEMLLDPNGQLEAGERYNLYVTLHLGISRLHNLVDNLLESANIEARRFRIFPRAANLGQIVDEAVQTMQPLILKHDQHLSIYLPPHPVRVKADFRRVVQVLVNLLSNANRYSPQGGEIELVVSTQANQAQVRIKDRGPGIPLAQRENVFERFVCSPQGATSHQAGAGVGLSVVKAIIEAHAGRVGYDEREGGGSIFWFSLPLAGGEV